MAINCFLKKWGFRSCLKPHKYRGRFELPTILFVREVL